VPRETPKSAARSGNTGTRMCIAGVPVAVTATRIQIGAHPLRSDRRPQPAETSDPIKPYPPPILDAPIPQQAGLARHAELTPVGNMDFDLVALFSVRARRRQRREDGPPDRWSISQPAPFFRATNSCYITLFMRRSDAAEDSVRRHHARQRPHRLGVPGSSDLTTPQIKNDAGFRGPV
jgi:hypothetical protein